MTAVNEIFGPFFAMFALTLAVWVFMYVRRLAYIAANRIDPQELTTPEKGAAQIPERVNWPAYNFRNLFEMPVLFYAACLYLFVTQSVDAAFVVAAWVFVGFRVLHSLVHCTVNIVRLRFLMYVFSAVALWWILIRAACQFFS